HPTEVEMQSFEGEQRHSRLAAAALERNRHEEAPSGRDDPRKRRNAVREPDPGHETPPRAGRHFMKGVAGELRWLARPCQYIGGGRPPRRAPPPPPRPPPRAEPRRSP